VLEKRDRSFLLKRLGNFNQSDDILALWGLLLLLVGGGNWLRLTRVLCVGGSQKLIKFELENTITGERSLV